MALVTLAEALARRSVDDAGRPACTCVVDGDDHEITVTYDTLHAGAASLAERLSAIGRPGDRVLLLFPQTVEYVRAFFACLYADMVAVPLFPPHPSRLERTLPRLLSVVHDADAKIALTDRESLARFGSMLSAVPELEKLVWIAADDIPGDPHAHTRSPSLSHPAFLQYTSGSTGAPKGVILSHQNLVENIAAIIRHSRRTRDSVGVLWVPIFHDMGLIEGVLTAIFGGYRTVFMPPTAFLQHPVRWLRAISKHRGTHTQAPNFAYDLCVARVSEEEKAGLDLSSLAMMLNGAEPVRPSSMRAFAEAFRGSGLDPRVLSPAYGLAEATVFVAASPLEEGMRSVKVRADDLETNKVVFDGGARSRELALSGVPADGVHVEIVHPETLRRVGPGEIGEIWLRGCSIGQGYWNRPRETEAVFRAAIEGEGRPEYLRTGDLGFMHEGQVVVSGRIKDLIIVAGANHYPQDIELSAERAHPGFRPGCAAAFTVEEGGEERLVVVLEVDRRYSERRLLAAEGHPPKERRSRRDRRHRPESDPNDPLSRAPFAPDAAIVAVRRAVFEGHELAVHTVMLLEPGSVPKTSSGKIQRRQCRRDFLAGKLPTIARWTAEPAARTERSVNADVDTVTAWLTRQIEARVPGNVRVEPSSTFAELGLDSKTAVELIGALEKWLGLKISPTLLWDFPSIQAVARHLVDGVRLPHPIGDVLVASGKLTRAALDSALVEQRRSEERPPLGEVLVRKGALSKSDLERALAAQETLRGMGRPQAEPIAVVGLGCRFPGAKNPHELWRNLVEGRSATGEVPAGRWDSRLYPSPVNAGGFLEDVDRFDAEFFNITPREARSIDPQHRLLLEVCWEALENAAIPASALAGAPVGVFVGISNNDYPHLLASRAPLEEVDGSYGIGGALSASAGRLSYFFGFRGPAMAIDAACASSLLAVHQACWSLRNRECTSAVAGGVNLIFDPTVSVGFAKAGMLAPDGRCKSFDASADGYVRSEGCGLVVLKRLQDALSDGDRILAVIRGSSVNQDGRTSGITAPNGPAQSMVIRDALRSAGVAPSTVDYLEAHGAGTPLGDPIEVNALAEVYGEGRPIDRPILVGSIKSAIGHAESAAGVAGLIKTILAVRFGLIPPTLHLAEVNGRIGRCAGVAFPKSPVVWPEGQGRRRAAVSSFGFVGTNVHLVLEEAPPLSPASLEPRSSVDLLPLSAKTPAALSKLAARYRDWLERGLAPDLADLCHTARVGRVHHRHRAAIVFSAPEELRAELTRLAEAPPLSDGGAPPPGELAALMEDASVLRARDLRDFLARVAELYLRGADVDWARLEGGEARRRADAPTYPFERRRHWFSDSLPAVAAAVARAAQPAADFYEIAWPRQDAGGAGSERRRRILIVGGSAHRMEAALAPRLSKDEVIALPRGRSVGPDDRATDIVYIAGLDARPASALDAVSLEDEQRTISGGLLDLVQSLTRERRTAVPRLWAVTCGAPDRLSAGPLWGLLQVIRLEHPELSATGVDVDSPDAAADAIARELSANEIEDAVAYRGGARHVARLRRSALENGPKTLADILRPDRSIVISGGLGALGLQAAEFLAERGARSLVLFGRRPPTDEAHGRIRRIEETGAAVEAVALDVADEAGLGAWFEGRARKGMSIGGVLHAAGILDDAAIASLTVERMMRVMAPKVLGAFNLFRHAAPLDLDFFALFSSMAGMAGNAGQAAYAAANAFLDRLAEHGRAEGVPAVSVAYGPWDGRGMAGGRNPSKGVGLLDPRRALLGLERALLSKRSVVGMASIDWSRADMLLAGARPFLRELVAPHGNGHSRAVLFREAVERAPANLRPRVLVDEVRAAVAAVLGYETPSLLDVTRPFMELGVDSIIAVRISNALALHTAVHLPAAIALNHPSVVALADYLRAEVYADLFSTAESPRPKDRREEQKIEALTSEEAERMLESEISSILE